MRSLFDSTQRFGESIINLILVAISVVTLSLLLGITAAFLTGRAVNSEAEALC